VSAFLANCQMQRGSAALHASPQQRPTRHGGGGGSSGGGGGGGSSSTCRRVQQEVSASPALVDQSPSGRMLRAHERALRRAGLECDSEARSRNSPQVKVPSPRQVKAPPPPPQQQQLRRRPAPVAVPREQLRKALQERRTKESTALSPRPKEPQPPPPDEEPLRGEQPIPTEPPPHQEPQLSVPRARPTLPTSPQEERGAGVDMAVRLAALAERVAELESHKALARRDDLEWLVGSALSLSLYPRGARQLFLLHAGVAPRRCRRCRLASEPRGEARAAVAGARKCPRRVCGCVCGTGGELATAALTPPHARVRRWPAALRAARPGGARIAAKGRGRGVVGARRPGRRREDESR